MQNRTSKRVLAISGTSWLAPCSFVITWLAAAWAAVGAPTATYDVVIYGGTSAGVIAAVQTTRMSGSVVLVAPEEHIGGLTSGGLGYTDTGDKSVIGGLARAFYQRVKKHYDRPTSWSGQRPEQYDRYRPESDAMWTFEPHVAEHLFEQWIAQCSVTLVRGERLDRQSGVKMRRGNIVSIAMQSGRTFNGRMFVDATYEGDLMAAAGVTYTVGREANSQYGETLNGVQKKRNRHNHRFLKPVDPFVTRGDPSSGLVSGVHGRDPGRKGQADHRVQAYCFRMCLSNDPENQVPFSKPRDYDERRYELLLRNFEAGDLRVPLDSNMLPNRKTDTNNNGAFSTDYIGANYAYPDADYAQREEILRQHETYQKGLMWTLAHHRRVPDSVRESMSQWGLAADEFQQNDHWPHQLYVREARRMVADYVVTEHDCRRIRVAADPVGLGSYNMDSHNCQRYVTPQGTVQNEGDIQVSPGGPYAISYRAIVPRRGEARNLLVPVCLSASHIAYGSIRMEPVFMILGQSAATAAMQAIEAGTSVQEVDYGELRTRLAADGQVLDVPAAAQPKILLPAAQLDGVVVDDDDATFEGNWTFSSSTSPYVNDGYRYADWRSEGVKTARFETRLKPGQYDVRLGFPAHANRATNARVRIVHADGTTTRTVNQRRPGKTQEAFVPLGRFTFRGSAVVIISNDGTDGYVIADAVQFVRVP